MISIRVKRDAKGVKDYFKEHLETGEYYSEKGKHDGIWCGKALEHLGIAEGTKVNATDFDALSDGFNPLTGEKLTARQKDKRRSCYDMVFSAPKSLSIMALISQDERLIEAHHEALNQAFFAVEARAQARIRKGHSINGDDNRITGNLASCRFTHRSSRALDPQLHTHCVVFNATYDPVEKRMKALQPGEIYASAKFITAIYRNELAAQVRKLGYELEESRYGWRIKGLPKEIETLFSKRAEFIKELKKKFELEVGTTLDNNAISHLALITRAEKNGELSDEDLLNLQKGQMTSHQVKMVNLLKDTALAKRQVGLSPLATRTDEPAREAIRYASNHIFARQSVAKKEDLLTVALTYSAGRASLSSLISELKTDDFIEVGDFITTRDEKKREHEILELIRMGVHGDRQLGVSTNLQPPKEEKYREQYLASTQLLDSKSQFLFLRGKAGVGKTYTLKQLIQNVSLPTILAAPTSSATETLRNEVSKQALTVQKLLLSDTEQERLSNSLLIIDEAGLLSTREMHSLLKIAKRQGAKILFVGDTRQHTSVMAGDALRLIENHSPIPIAEISAISRQKEIRYLEAVKALSKGEVLRGLNILEKMGSIKSIATDGNPLNHEERAKAVAQEYLKNTQAGHTSIVVTPTWDEHERVTDKIRAALKENGLLSKEEVKIKIQKSLGFTDAQKCHSPHLEPGIFLSFHTKIGKFEKGETWEVILEQKGQLLVKAKNGEERLIHPKKYAKAFDAVKLEERGFSQDDLILLKANYTDSKGNMISNGTIRKVVRIDPDKTVHLENNMRLDPKFTQFVHGYATTSQGSQGKTRDFVIISADSSAAKSLSQNQLYVSASRGIQGATIFTDDLNKFREAVHKSANRKLVVEANTKKAREQELTSIFKGKLQSRGFTSPRVEPNKSKMKERSLLKTHVLEKTLRKSPQPNRNIKGYDIER